MIFDNTLILRGNYYDIKDVKDELNNYLKKPKTSKLYSQNTVKAVTKMMIDEEIEVDGLYNLRIKFKYKKANIEEFIKLFSLFPVEVIHLCENSKNEVWIVNKEEYIIKYQLIPTFAVHKILLDYMEYKDSAIILDSYETIKYDLYHKKITVNNKSLTNDELLALLFEKTIKGKVFIDLIENFTNNCYQKCINSYEELYSINKESSHTEVKTTTPLALFIVTFGLFGLILALLKMMGYI